MRRAIDNLTLAVELFRKCEQVVSIEGRFIKLVLPQDLDDKLSEALEDSDLLLANSGGSVEITKPPTFFNNLDELLQKAERRIKPPDHFYLVDSDWINNEAQAPQNIINYRSAVKLLNLLKEVADHPDNRGNDLKLIFLHQEKLVFGSKYISDDLRPFEGLSKLDNDFINSSTHKEKKRQIFKSVLVEKYKGRDKVELGEVIKDFDEILSRLINGYDLFVSEFSFQKIRSEIEKDKLEFTVRLNKVFSDIQNQLLAVPAALLLVGSQLEKVSPAGWEIKNVVIWLGALVFTILMELLIRNQRSTLQAIKNEINLQEQMFEEHHKAVFHKFKDVYVQLSSRFKHQRNLLCFVRFIVGCALGFTSAMLFWYSTDSDWTKAAYLGALVGIFPTAWAVIEWCSARCRRFFSE